MILSYPLRLLCLCLAVFFWMHLAVGIVVALLAPAAIRKAERMDPRSAARMLFVLRLLPVGSALFVVAVFCVPSFLWLEPNEIVEQVGWASLIAAGLGLSVWAISAVRAFHTARAIAIVCGPLPAERVHYAHQGEFLDGVGDE